MTAHRNVELLREFYAAQGRFYAGEAGPEAVTDYLADDIAWHVPGRNAIAGHYRGRQAVLDYFARRRDKADNTFKVTVRRTLADDDYVLQLAGGRATLQGRTREWETVGVYRIANTRIAECWLVPFDQQAFDEIWA